MSNAGSETFVVFLVVVEGASATSVAVETDFSEIVGFGSGVGEIVVDVAETLMVEVLTDDFSVVVVLVVDGAGSEATVVVGFEVAVVVGSAVGVVGVVVLAFEVAVVDVVDISSVVVVGISVVVVVVLGVVDELTSVVFGNSEQSTSSSKHFESVLSSKVQM